MITETNHGVEVRARMIELAGEVAAARDKAARDAVALERSVTECMNLHQELGNAHRRNRVLEEQLLTLFGPAAGAPVHAQTGITPGAENASNAKETHTPLGAAPTPVAGSEWPAWARDLDKVATDMKQIEVATGNLFSELATILGTVGADTFEQAAAAMAAESAEMVAEAERSVAARSGTPIVSRLVVEVDTTQLDAALAKAERLQVVLAGLSPQVVLS